MTRPITLPEPWRSLAAKLGGVQHLADALHSHRRTVYKWANGERTPRGPTVLLIRELFIAHGITPTI